MHIKWVKKQFVKIKLLSHDGHLKFMHNLNTASIDTVEGQAVIWNLIPLNQALIQDGHHFSIKHIKKNFFPLPPPHNMLNQALIQDGH